MWLEQCREADLELPQTDNKKLHCSEFGQFNLIANYRNQYFAEKYGRYWEQCHVIQIEFLSGVGAFSPSQAKHDRVSCAEIWMPLLSLSDLQKATACKNSLKSLVQKNKYKNWPRFLEMATRRNYVCVWVNETFDPQPFFFLFPAETCKNPLLWALTTPVSWFSRMINTVNPLGWDFQNNLKRKTSVKEISTLGTLAIPVCGPQQGRSPGWSWDPSAGYLCPLLGTLS